MFAIVIASSLVAFSPFLLGDEVVHHGANPPPLLSLFFLTKTKKTLCASV